MAKKKQEPPAHGESWLVSYCDMISLLVTFFLMMMTFSTKDRLDVKETGVGLLHGRGGIWKNMMALPQEHSVDPSVVDALARDLAAVAEQQGENANSTIQGKLDGLTITFDLASSFAPGSAEVRPALNEQLQRLARSFERYTHLIVVEGFTDDRFQSTPEFPEAHDLGLARARNAARVMLESCPIAPELLQVAGLGTERPRASNDTPAGRTSNRRVEVRVLALARPDAGHGEVGPQWKDR